VIGVLFLIFSDLVRLFLSNPHIKSCQNCLAGVLFLKKTNLVRSLKPFFQENQAAFHKTGVPKDKNPVLVRLNQNFQIT